MTTPLYQELARTVAWYHRVVDNTRFRHPVHMVEEKLNAIMQSSPSGSGIDSGTKLDLDANTGGKLVFNTDFHHMNEHGYYDGWSNHQVIVRPCLQYGLKRFHNSHPLCLSVTRGENRGITR